MSKDEAAEGRPLPDQHRGRPLAERPGAPPPRCGREARRLRALPAPPRGGSIAGRRRLVVGGRPAPPPVRPVARVPPAPVQDRRLPLLLRPHLRPQALPVPDPAPVPEEVRLPLHRLGHPRPQPGRARCTAGSADAQIVGSYDAIRWVPDAVVVPPGIDLREFEPVPAARARAPARRPRAVQPHAQGHGARDRRVPRSSTSTSRSSRACTTTEARERYERADIVVDQLNAGWYGLFAIEAMALGKPVVTSLHEDADARAPRRPSASRCRSCTRRRRRSWRRCGRSSSPLRRGRAHRRRRAGSTWSRCTTSSRNADRLSTSTAGSPRRSGASRASARRSEPGRIPILDQITRLAKQSAIYGLGGLVSRILAVLLLPLYTSYLSTGDYGKIETLVAATAVLVIVLRARDLERVLPLLLRRRGRRGADARRPDELLVHDGERDGGADRGLPARRARSRRCSNSGVEDGPRLRSRRRGCGRR